MPAPGPAPEFSFLADTRLEHPYRFRDRALSPRMTGVGWIKDSGSASLPHMDLRNSDFIQLVKRTREEFGVSIQEAHDRIFLDEEVRRLVAVRVNRDSKCRKMAHHDIRRNGDQSRFIRDGGRILFRRNDGQRNV